MAKKKQQKTYPSVPRVEFQIKSRGVRRRRQPYSPNWLTFSKAADKKCAAKKKGKCQVQLVFERGRELPVLKFCTRAGSKGTRIPVKSVQQALDISSNMCDCIKKGNAASKCKTNLGR